MLSRKETVHWRMNAAERGTVIAKVRVRVHVQTFGAAKFPRSPFFLYIHISFEASGLACLLFIRTRLFAWEISTLTLYLTTPVFWKPLLCLWVKMVGFGISVITQGVVDLFPSML
jgi:hypothetical protein